MKLRALSFAAAAALFGQGKLEFDVATVRPAPPPEGGRIRVMLSGGPGSQDPGRLNYENQTLRNVMAQAYGVRTYQISGPAWVDQERYNFTAKVPAGATKEQFREMLQNLLLDRFKMTVHRETRELPAYALVVGKGGPKLKSAAPEDPNAQIAPPPAMPAGGPVRVTMGKDGFPQMPPGAGRGGMAMMMMPGRARMQATSATMARLAKMLEGQTDRAVIDETGLKGSYEFTLTFEPDMSRMAMLGPPGMGRGPMGAGGDGAMRQPDAEPAPNLFTAVQEQLGLKLEPKKTSVEVIVIDRAEKTPSEN